jgi:hypothetical protein
MNDEKPPAIDPAVLESLQTVRTDVTGSIDLEQLEHRLSLTPAQRLGENDRFARFIAIVREAGRKARDGNFSPPAPSDESGR